MIKITVDNSVADSYDRRYNIDDEAIEAVGRLDSKLLSDKRIDALQAAQRDALRNAKRYPVGTEVGNTYDMSMNPLSSRTGTTGSVALPHESVPYISIHNHPSGLFFSPGDIDSFITHENHTIMTVVGNNGATYLLEKLANYDASGFINLFRVIYDSNDVIESINRILREAGRYGINFIG